MKHLIDFINENRNWKEILAAEPYFCMIKDEGCYTLIKYTQGLTNFNFNFNFNILECRGIIVKKTNPDTYRVVCHGLNKFFNKGEVYAAKLNWDSGVYMYDKIDGTNIRLWWDDGKWHISTLGVIAAENTIYGVLFKQSIQDFDRYVEGLDKNYTYVYELVSPQTRIVCQYKDVISFFICARNLIFNSEELNRKEVLRNGVRSIPHSNIKNTQEALKYIEELGENCEGIVCVDGDFNRVKLKTEWYLALHKAKNNGIQTVRRVAELWKEDALDDFLGNFPEYNEFVSPCLENLRTFTIQCETAFHFLMEYIEDRKVFAAKVQSYPPLVQSVCFAAAYKNRHSAIGEIIRDMKVSTLTRIMEGKI